MTECNEIWLEDIPSKNEDIDTCPICFREFVTDYNEAFVLDCCSQKLCLFCYSQWFIIHNKRNCMYCRKKYIFDIDLDFNIGTEPITINYDDITYSEYDDNITHIFNDIDSVIRDAEAALDDEESWNSTYNELNSHIIIAHALGCCFVLFIAGALCTLIYIFVRVIIIFIKH
tara:strand:- start:2377 stop:2892 length:516 start_codon:yes stop_codon:yes gene_type:complete